MKVQLTVKHLLEGELNSNGFGLYKHPARDAYTWRKSANPYTVIKMIDEVVVDIANYFGATEADLQGFMDSKLGRWAGDVIISETYPDDRTIDQAIKKYFKQYLSLSPAEKAE